jgi:asparagine synthase (glutamine-hydrolysing)
VSGIAGVVQRDGTEVDRALLDRLTRFLAYRGPDGAGTWAAGAAGLCHTLLRTGDDVREQPQPATLDDRAFIVADARIDGRPELVAKLERTGGTTKPTSDAELILAAYAQWGTTCVEHLLGDFAFAIWDAPRKRLFCARDHFGVKPFFYAATERALVFSNTLDCVRQHPAVSNRISDLAVADYLLFQSSQDPEVTIFEDIRRVPAAHTLTADAGGVTVSRYWTLPYDGVLRLRRSSEYVERYHELLSQAVHDRVRTRRVSILMSGGLDSTSVAAAALGRVPGSAPGVDVKAFCAVYDRLMPDQERRFSTVAARGLGIPIAHRVADDYAMFQAWDDPSLRRPEPKKDPFAALERDLAQEAGDHSRVVLTGMGGDPPFYNSYLFLRPLCSVDFAQRLFGSALYAVTQRALPPLALRTRIRQALGRHAPWRPPYPYWLKKDFAQRLQLFDRWDTFTREKPQDLSRPSGFPIYLLPFWPEMFEYWDAGSSRLPLEQRHPLYDVRLVTFLLSLPYLPWAVDKHLVRRGMHAILPHEIVRRPKAPLVDNPWRVRSAEFEAIMEAFEPTRALGEYVETSAIPRRPAPADDGNEMWVASRIIGLDHWLRQEGCL